MKFLISALLISLEAIAQDDIEEFEEFESKPAAPEVRVSGRFDPSVAVDTRFDSTRQDRFGENVADVRMRSKLSLDASLSRTLRVHVEGWAKWRGVTQVEFQRAKADFEPFVGETYIDWIFPKVDLRVGYQRMALGANPLFSPADALNPYDLSEVSFVGVSEYARLPIFGVSAKGQFGAVDWTAAVTPFFQSHRYSVFGQDESLVQPGLGIELPWQAHPSVENEVQARLLETQRPNFGDLALRGKTKWLGFDLGASWVWMNEKLPFVALSSDAVSVTRGSYARRHLLSVEASRLVGSAQWDLDVTYSPGKTLDSMIQSSWLWALGVSQARDSNWLYSLHYFGMWGEAWNIPALAVLPSRALESSFLPRELWLHLLLGQVGYRTSNRVLEVSLSFAADPRTLSWSLSPRVSSYLSDKWRVWLAAEFFEGAPWSPLGYWGRNDQIAIGAEWLFL